MQIHLVEDGQNVHIGTIKQPFQYCDIVLEIYDEMENMVLKIQGSCYQMGIHCPHMPCDSCQNIHFDIKDVTDNNIGLLDKKTKGCMKEMNTNGDNFEVEFP